MALFSGRSATAMRRAVFYFDHNVIIIWKERLSLCDVGMYVVCDHW